MPCHAPPLAPHQGEGLRPGQHRTRVLGDAGPPVKGVRLGIEGRVLALLRLEAAARVVVKRRSRECDGRTPGVVVNSRRERVGRVGRGRGGEEKERDAQGRSVVMVIRVGFGCNLHAFFVSWSGCWGAA